MQHGLALGHHFGVIGSTDHHSAYPGSYGHGRTGLWAKDLTRDGIWEALTERRTYALTGNRITMQFSVDGRPMGARVAHGAAREIQFNVVGGAPLDCVDVVRNGRLLRRFSRLDFPREEQMRTVRTKVFLEVGWGQRNQRTDWEVHVGISDGRVLAVEPRFRGLEVVAPTELQEGTPDGFHLSHWEPDGDLAVWFRTVTFGNPNNRTPATQGMCLEVEMPHGADVVATINGRSVTLPLAALVAGARSGRLAGIVSPAYRFHRAPAWWELEWNGGFADQEDPAPGDWYYLRVREMNDEWAWSSPVWIE
jgi:hypothetical protein